MARSIHEVMTGLVTLSIIERRRPDTLILAVNLHTLKASTYYSEVVGSLRLHPKRSRLSRVQRAWLYTHHGDNYTGIVYLTDFVYGIFHKVT